MLPCFLKYLQNGFRFSKEKNRACHLHNRIFGPLAPGGSEKTVIMIAFWSFQTVQSQMQEMSVKDEPAQVIQSVPPQVTQSVPQKEEFIPPQPAPVAQPAPQKQDILRPKPPPVNIPKDSANTTSDNAQRVCWRTIFNFFKILKLSGALPPGPPNWC